LVLAVIGGVIHWTFGSISTPVLAQLLLGGIPGVILGCILAPKVPAQKLKAVVAILAICAGAQLVWSGARALGAKSAAGASNAARINTGVAVRP
jgi:uncharacterized membrane protein YfcA